MPDRASIDFAALFDHALDGVLLTKPHGAIAYANPAACAMFGYTRQELVALGRPAVVDLDEPRVKVAIEERDRNGRFAGILPLRRKDGSEFVAQLSSVVYESTDGELLTAMFVRDLSESDRRESALQATNEKLQRALDEVEALRGILPICAYCKNVRNDEQYWVRVEEYFSAHSNLRFTHSICPSCATKHFP